MNTLLAAIDMQRGKLAPATSDEITKATASLLTHAAAIGIKVENPVALKAVWSAHCRDMPGHLLATGLAAVLKHWTNTYCLPAPGAVWDQIETELDRMRADLATMERARFEAVGEIEPEDRKPSDETDAVLAETRRILKSAGARRRAA